MIHFYLEKFDRGAWNVAYFDSRYPDVCQGLQNPASIWYPMTSKFKKKNCPFPAGHVETFDNVVLYEVPDELPNTLAGKYRFFQVSTFLNGLKKETECFGGGMEVYEL